MVGIKNILRRNRLISKLYYKFRKHPSSKKKYIKGSGNVFKDLGLISRTRRIIIGDNNYVENGVGANVSNTKIHISGSNNKVTIGSGTYLDNSVIWIQGNNCELNIGKNVSVEGASFAIAEDNQKIEIGDDCLFSYKIEFKTSDSHSIIDMETNKRINPAQSIKLGRHVWLGAQVTILKGVTIGDNSIIGTGSIVTKDIPTNVIATGIPAKVVKENINWDRRLL